MRSSTPETLEAWRIVATGAGQDWPRLASSFADPQRPTRGEIRRLDAAIHAAALDEDQPPDSVLRHVVLELTAARRRARLKWRTTTETPDFLGDLAGIEQASGSRVAEYKAGRLLRAGVRSVVDLCSGVGGDASAFARAFGREHVRAVDRDPCAAFWCQHNAGCEVLVDDLEAGARAALATLEPGAVALHFDPARRDARGRRGAALSDLEPSLGRCLALVHELGVLEQGGALRIKLSPALDVRELDAALRGSALAVAQYEIEWIAEPEGLVQAVVSIGLGAPPDRIEHRATRILSELGSKLETASFAARPRGAGDFDPGEDDPGDRDDRAHPSAYAWLRGRTLLEPDPVLERSGLFRQWVAARTERVRALHPGLGLLALPEGAEVPEDAGFRCRSARIVDVLPWRVKKLKQWIRESGRTVVELRTRGAAIDLPATRRALHVDASARSSPEAVALWGLRFGKQRVAIFTESRLRAWTSPHESA